jgi:hypothetical protein
VTFIAKISAILNHKTAGEEIKLFPTTVPRVQKHGHQPADGRGGKHPGVKERTPSGAKVKPIKPRQAQNQCEDNHQQMPKNHPSLEAAGNVAGQSGEKSRHALI